MCGRYRRRSDKQRIAEAFEVGMGLDELYLDAQDDIAPGSVQPVVVENADGARRMEMMRWGFKLPDRFLFNARSEGVETSRFWKESFRQRRCLVPADSFYEWQKVKSGKKPKYEFEIVGRQPFGMAGIWAPWKNPKTGEMEHTFAILTGEANAVMRPIHDREPVIIEPREYGEYLARQERGPAHLLRILPEDELKGELVSA